MVLVALLVAVSGLVNVSAQSVRGRVPLSFSAALGGTIHARVMDAGGAKGSSIAPGASPAAPTESRAPASYGEIFPSPYATDPTGLTVTRTANGSGWTINLSWTGGTSPYTVSYSTDPGFRQGDETLAQGTAATTMSTQADGAASLECFTVTDSTTVSQAVQGTGYDPEPAPAAPSPNTNNLWWGDPVVFTSNYLDPIAKGNVVQMYDLPVRATDTNAATGARYATTATFTIPDDARSFYPFINVHGRASSAEVTSFVKLKPRGIAPFTNIHGCAYAPQTGHIWVAADGKVDEIDIFEHDPVIVRSITTYTKPYISRVTAAGRILVVNGVAGVGKIYQVDATSGAVTFYADTTDTTHKPYFTRSILPVGIAVDPDGSAVYIADASTGKLVRIPQNNTSAIIDNWGDYTWNFPDPCGIDVNVGHQVVATSAYGWYRYTTDQYNTHFGEYTQGIAYSLFVERDISTAGYFYVDYTNNRSVAEAFNLNPVNGAPAYHGSDIFGLADGSIEVDPDWGYFVSRHWPQRVVINNSGQNVAYPSSFQKADRIIQLKIWGWYGMYEQVRVIDPPDLSPYAPDGGCLQGSCTQAGPCPTKATTTRA